MHQSVFQAQAFADGEEWCVGAVAGTEVGMGGGGQ